MKQYLDLLQNILDNGVEKESGRANMPNTIGISWAVIKMNLKDGFPLLTTKQVYWKMIIHELLWFLRGETNIKYLVDNNVHIWDGDAYRWYKKIFKECHGIESDMDINEFLEGVKKELYFYPGMIGLTPEKYTYGDLGKVYGYQWRNQNGVDQIQDIITGLKENPYSRYHILDAWNKADFKYMALPPCHLLYQFIVRPVTPIERVNWAEKNKITKDVTGIWTNEWMNGANVPKFYLDLNMYQRSCDTFLGVPFNIASMSILLMIMAKVSNMIPGVSTWIGGDTHLYVDHIPIVKEQLSREPMKLPTLKINKELKNFDDILNLSISDFEVANYEHHSPLKGELFSGNKK
jgi:thymidylate synthase